MLNHGKGTGWKASLTKRFDTFFKLNILNINQHTIVMRFVSQWNRCVSSVGGVIEDRMQCSAGVVYGVKIKPTEL